MNLSKKINFGNIIIFIFLLLFISRQEVFIIPVIGQRLFMALIFIFSLYILAAKNIGGIFFKSGKYLIFCNIYLTFILLIGFGDLNDLFGLWFTYIIATSFFIIGLYFGYNHKTFLIDKFFLWLFVLTFLNIIPFLVYTIQTQEISKTALSQFFNLGLENTMIMFWPLIFIVGFIGYYFNIGTVVKKWQKVTLKILFAVFIILMIVSSFTAVVLMLVISFLVFNYLKFKDKISLKSIFGFGISLGIVLYILTLIADGTFGELGGTREKITAVLAIFESGEQANFEEQLDVASSTRYSLLDISYENISKSPFVGNGYYFASVGQDINKQVASGHSSFFDFLAYFGLFAIPFFLIFVNFLFVIYKFSIKVAEPLKSKAYALFAVLFSYSLISISNPYLQFSTFDLLFLLSGWVIGQNKTIKSLK